MMAKGIKVIIATVPASASIQIRAQELRADIAAGAAGRNVNIIAYVPLLTHTGEELF